MDARSTAAEPQHPYSAGPWTAPTPTTPAAPNGPGTASASSSNNSSVDAEAFANGALNGVNAQAPDASLDAAAAAAAAAAVAGAPYPPHVDFLPLFFPQQSSVYHAQLLHYNKLISPARGGGLQTAPLPPVVSASNAQAASRSRSSSKVSLKDSTAGKGNSAGGHGSRSHHTSDKNRLVITPKEAPSKMPAKQQHADTPRGPARPAPRSVSSHGPPHSSSVPSTPHQHARKFSFEDREPSPNAANNHSPRSAYSETNSTLPSLRPLPPRLGGCRFETAQINSRRRIPYSVGNERLEKLDLRTVKDKLSEDEERKLATDMRELYDRLLPTDAVEEKRTRLVHKLEKIFNDEWPGHDIRVHLFGSSGNFLCSDDSDVDICITTSWHELEGVCMIADLLARRGMEKVVCISAAKVPIVKIWDPELRLACDMNVNNTLALENTRMIRTYVEVDPRVRQLAMVIKYWARRRVVNDAGFGGTLSSYTWICLIIAFLQLRSPPVLPALHQLRHKLPKPDGTTSDFADDLKKLKGFGNKNKSSQADLLFQFFRFYAHEFDYDKHVLSVRLGKLVTKTEKKWYYAINNLLCVEEPFNTSRNLGNTADEYSFRGLHLELRRAFDLISASKLDEACAVYVFPKEEEKVWSRPAPQSRPVLLRSSSQTHSGRGGRGNHRGGRHNNNFHRGGAASRRASSSVPAYDPNVLMPPMGIPQELSWYYNPQFPFQYVQQDLMTQMAYQENMRHMQLYAHPALAQGQGLGQQRMQAGSSSGQQSAGRSRTSSFDNPPLSAPAMQPTDLYAVYGFPAGQAFFPQMSAGYGAYTTSPAAASPAGQDFRRPLQRSTVTTDTGASASSSSLRSQSQPAARSQTAPYPTSGYAMAGSQTPTGTASFVSRNANGIPIPSFMPDDADFDETPRAKSDSPLSEAGFYGGHVPPGSSSPTQNTQQVQGSASGIAFGDLASLSGPGRRRLSTDQLPQTILDRRIRRASRSPSPMGHARAFSVGTSSAPLTSAPFPGSQNRNSKGPLVVNGSGLKASMIAAARQAPGSETSAADDVPSARLENPLRLNLGPSMASHSVQAPETQTAAQEAAMLSRADRPPLVVNGSNVPIMPPPADDTSFRERIALMNSQNLGTDLQEKYTAPLSPSARQRLAHRPPHNEAIAPLDLAIREESINRMGGPDMAHLSPVYETRTPSPTALRKFDSGPPDKAVAQSDAKSSRGEPAKPTARLDAPAPKPGDGFQVPTAQKPVAQASKLNVPRENGHVRGAKSETDGGWQKAGKGKKKAGIASLGQQGQAEQLPKHNSERKGG